ncbi:hypothetical protein [Bernardetia sp.]|uniref:hypothetical protein n=1 Tax=Bernardetia sp. TaxID=1937974 RepID=UPI0025C6CC10|nr:hypothetical protein [Bernardetia sp.]
MKSYILLFLLILVLFFSCTKKSVVNNKQPYFTEEQKQTESVVTTNEPTNFENYNDAEFDSLFHVSLDSIVDLLNVVKFDKDTIIKNEFTFAMYSAAKNGFSDFAFIESMYPDLLDSLKTPTYLYVKHNDKFELKNQFEFSEMSWRNSEVQQRDINFDGKADILLQRPWFANRMIADYLIIMDSNFERITETNSTYELLINEKNKTVISFIDGGNCCTHHKIINKWQGDSLVKIRSLEKSYNHAEGGQILEEFVIKNGEKTKIKSQKMSSDKAEAYFENYQ